jgi:DNA replication protein DnaC
MEIMDEEDRQEQERVRISLLKRRWSEICPPLYMTTNPDDSRLSQKIRRILEAWQPSEDGKGLAIFGGTGKGKTRLIFWRLHTLWMSGAIKSLFAISSVRLGRAIAESFDDDKKTSDTASDILSSVRMKTVLFIDDVGKEKFTERVASDFYELIEHRTSYMLTTIWTTNLTSAELASKLGDKGDPTIRRLKEFSQCIEA